MGVKFINEGPSECRVMAPGEVDLLSTFVCQALAYAQYCFIAPQAHTLNQMKRRADRANLETNFDLIRFIPGYVVAPRKQQNLPVLSDLGSMMQRQVAAVRQHFLPSAFIVVHMRSAGARARGDEV